MAKKSSGSTFNGKPIFSSGVKRGAPSSPSNISGDSGSFWKNTMAQALQPRPQEEPFSLTQSFDSIMSGGKSPAAQSMPIGTFAKSLGFQSPVNQSFGGGGGIPSLSGLASASMSLADAASRRELAQKQAEAEMSARMQGYSSLEDMQREMRRQRRRSLY